MLKPLIELLLAGALWGFGFPATVWALQALDAPAILFYRFMGAALIGFLPLLIWTQTSRGQKTLPLGKLWGLVRNEARVAWKPGIWLFLTIAFQTFGLLTTTATKSAFITTLYVVMVPIIASITGQDRMKVLHWLWVFLALLGLALFQDLKIENWSVGDSLTLCAAVAATFHILSIGKYAPQSKSPYLLNLWQMGWTGLFALFLLPIAPRADVMMLDSKGVFGMIALIFGSGLLAFYLQIRAQEKIAPNLASLLFLLESPFSALFAFWLLSERFSDLQWAGGAVILVACAAAIITGTSKKKQQMGPGTAGA